MAKTPSEREQAARQAKLEHVQDQIASGELVIRKMTAEERARWAKKRKKLDAASTPAEKARRAAALENRRKRSERFS